MRIVLFTHPAFLRSQSMPRFSTMLEEGMSRLGHKVERWTASPRAHALPTPRSTKKWLGYVDQYLLFPHEMKRRLAGVPKDTLFVFADQALGPWVPLVADRPHVIHCHDFLAQRSALGEIPQNPTGWTGRQYQRYIRAGYTEGRNFISVSEKTRQDLHRFLGREPNCSEVVYNGLNQAFAPHDQISARSELSRQIGKDFSGGYLLHVGGNQWYKNRKGVIEIYEAWRKRSNDELPLLMIGPPANLPLQQKRSQSPYKESIHCLSGVSDEAVRMAYAGASAFLFPSWAEGFGWPIAEAMASGCPVITTGEEPMTEVAGDAGFLIPRQPESTEDLPVWAEGAAEVLASVLSLGTAEKEKVAAKGIQNARRFDPEATLDRIESIYKSILNDGSSSNCGLIIDK